MARSSQTAKQNLLKNYLTSLSLAIILLGINSLAIASTNKKAFRFEDIQNQIIDLAPTETDIPTSLKEQLRKQCKIVILKAKKGAANYSTGKADLEILQPEKGHENYVNFNPTNMYFSAQEIDLNNDNKPELEVTYNGFQASAINWPLWIFSIEGENYIPILKATVGQPGYTILQSVNSGYHDILTTKTILDNPNEEAKNEFTIYKFDGSKYIIESKFIELPSQNPNKSSVPKF